jgi:RimJ/RimL family protein N-acetyltransferase
VKPFDASKIDIRPIRRSDAASFRDCLDSVARERRYLAQLEAPPLERMQEFVAANIDSNAVQYVAVEGERVVGWADILPHWAAALAHCGTFGMGVLADRRGAGIGTRLIAACLQQAPSRGITRVELQARADNVRAIQLYEKTGFVAEARLRRAMRFDGVYHDAVQMSWLAQS